MSGKRRQSDVDAQIDLHGMTAERLRIALQQHWPAWRGLRAVRIVHGQGTVLKPEIERWCAEMGLPYLPDSRNAGALCIYPQRRSLPDASLGNTLRESGLRLTVEQEAELRDPALAERNRQAELQRRRLEEQSRRAQAAARTAQQSQDEALWQAEMARLGVSAGGKARAAGEDKPRPPVIVPKLQLKFEEGYWRAELSRVADTDTQTLQTQKRTGLDKLAPPMKEERPEAEARVQPVPSRPSQRDAAAERELFEVELERLGGVDGFEMRRGKTEG